MKEEQDFDDLGADEEMYSKEGRDYLVDSDEISPWEAAFMEGADDYGKGAKCRSCGKVLLREKIVVEKVIKGELYRFCSEECLDDYEETH